MTLSQQQNLIASKRAQNFTIYRDKAQSLYLFFRNFFKETTPKNIKVDAHKKEVIDIILASLLGNGWGEKRGNAVRFHLHYSSKNVKYLGILHKFLIRNGYCGSQRVRKMKQIGRFGRVFYSIKIRTYSFQSFQFLYSAFYKEGKIKVMPKHISKLLTPRALAFWIMDDAHSNLFVKKRCSDRFYGRFENANRIQNKSQIKSQGETSGQDLKISINKFTKVDVDILRCALLKNFQLRFTLQWHKGEYFLCLSKSQFPALEEILKPFLLRCIP